MSSPPKSPSSPKGSRSPKVGKLIDTIRNSPAFIRKHMHGHKDSSRKQDASPVFYAQYLGKEEVSTLRFRHCNDVVDHLIESAKRDAGKKLKKCTLHVRKLSIDIDLSHSKDSAQIPLHNIAYCAADMKYPKVFTFIAKDSGQNGQLVCYAFLCNKQEKARAMTLCLSKAFETAFLEWQQSKQKLSKLSQSQAQQSRSTRVPDRVQASAGREGAGHDTDTTVQATEDSAESSDESDILSPEEEASMHREFTRRESTMRRPSLLPLGNILEELENDETVTELVTGESSPNHGDMLDLQL
ncbi:low density lipoprotein receptor adapter protein 1-A-like [Ptychodera flava]|uniref:low density lipoprotein receptor adapter protein 1-A-like n=1 Tax=Ptychodera flava TaxID=63121 RepID=UPI00396A52E2